MRRVLFWCHLTVALCAGVVITIMAATGVALAYQRQILAAVAARHAVAAPEAGAKQLPLDSLAQRLASEPTHLEIASITLNSDPTMPLVVGLADRHSIFVDPYTAKVLGNDDAARGFFRAVERWHRSIAIGTGRQSAARAIWRSCSSSSPASSSGGRRSGRAVHLREFSSSSPGRAGALASGTGITFWVSGLLPCC